MTTLVDKNGWVQCPACKNDAWQQTIDTQFGGPVTTITCGRCDRSRCDICGTIDQVGLLKEPGNMCCGIEVGTKQKKDKKKGK